MESKEKRKRKISVLTIFLWLALVITMSVVVVSGINKSNALEDTTVEINDEETKTIIVKLDINAYIKWVNEYVDSLEEDENLKKSLKTIWLNEKLILSNTQLNLKDENKDNINEKNRLQNKNEDNIIVYEISIPKDTKYNYISWQLNFANFPKANNLELYYIEANDNGLDFNLTNRKTGVFEIKVIEEKDTFEFKLKKSLEPIKINIDYSQVDDVDKEKLKIYLKPLPESSNSEDYRNEKNMYILEENENYNVYNIYLIPNENISISMPYALREYGVFENGKLLEDNIFINNEYYYKKIVLDEENTEYNFEIKKIQPEISSSIKWKDDDNIKLEFEVKNKRGFYAYDQPSDNAQEWSYYIILSEKLNENFKVSEKYENVSEWLIVNEEDIINTKFDNKVWVYGEEEYYRNLISDLEVNQNIPEYIFATFFDYNEIHTGNGGNYGEIYLKDEKRYIYVKDKNMLYCVRDKNNISESINLEYKNNNKNISNIKFDFSTKATYFYRLYLGSTLYEDLEYMDIPINKKEIEYKTQEKTEIIVNKITKDEENKTYYVGLFSNDKDEITDKIYELETEDGVGSIKIDIADFDKSNKYYVYEVDNLGKKIEDENIKYNKNRVLEKENIVNRYKILSNKDVVSSVLTTAELEENIRVIKNLNGGEERYIDNSLLCEKVNEDTVTIAPLDLHIVKYETEHQGKLDGKTKEAVKHGNKPVNVPNVIVNDGYEFDKWVVIKDGEEVEVNPSEYVILEDTTFIVKYKEIKIEENRDTSDINIWLYVGIAVISAIVICIIILALNIKNKNK